MGISDFISHYLSAPDSHWSFVSLTFAAVFLVFFAIYIVLRKWSKAVTLGYVVVFSLLFAYKANGVLMLLLPTTALLSYYLTRTMAAREGKARRLWMGFFDPVQHQITAVFFDIA